MTPAPIALFVYRRAEHTARTLAALARNELAPQSELFIFADGPAGEHDREAVAAVRALVRTVSGFRRVTVCAAESNRGLAASVTGGVSQLLAEYDRVIVLEDDLETSPFFLRFVNEGLERFADDERICQIHAYAEPSAYPEIPCFLRRGADCWGWGTWRRAWRLYNADGAALYRELCARRLRRSFDVEGAYPYTRMLRSQARGELDSWAIRWYASAFLAGRYMLQSNVPLVRNLGFDNSGTHGAPDRAGFALAEHPVRFDRTPVMETPGLRAEYRRQLRRARLSLPRRAALKVRRMLRKWSSINRRSHVVS